MPYHLHDVQLRVLRKYARQERNASALNLTRFLLLEHILPTTEEFVRHLVAAGGEVFALLAKPYSIDGAVLNRLIESGVCIHRKSYEELDDTSYLDQLIQSAMSQSDVDGKKIVIIDVGGYFAAPLARLPVDSLRHISGVVEDTTFGHNRYIKCIQNIGVPVFSVARSSLKEIEARFVGRDAVAAVDTILRRHGVTIAGRNALVIGYGMIGKNVARSLRANDLNVYVYDRHDNRNLSAYIDGFRIYAKRDLLKSADIIFSATADTALSFADIEECKDNVILVSVGSRDTEFDIRTIREQALEASEVSPNLKKYILPNSRAVLVVNDGVAVNFLVPSRPIEIMDLVFSELFLAAMLLVKKPGEHLPGVVHEMSPFSLDVIAKDWLRFVNS
ncbi:adenosylhomocysteinase [Dongia sp.]|uniref:adenosylhomocysteinase n=1 Tax=Dongia sp. TaxID=1977262 RepID=UPI0035AEDE1B